MNIEQLALSAAIGYIERNTPQLVHSEIAAELRRLAAENEVLLAENNLLEQHWNGAMATHKNQAALEAENAALRKDAERYRWLRINAIGAFRTNDGKGPVSVYHLTKIPAIPGIPEETDAAIDAAIAAQGEAP